MSKEVLYKIFCSIIILFKKSFIYLFNKYFLDNKCIPGMELSIGDMVMNRMAISPHAKSLQTMENVRDIHKENGWSQSKRST